MGRATAHIHTVGNYSNTQMKLRISITIFFLLIFLLDSCNFGPIPKSNRVYVIGEIVEVFPGKRKSCNVIFYDSLMNKYEAHYPNMIEKLQLGEQYKIAYDKNDFTNIDIYFSAPVIEDSLDFDLGTAIINKSVIENFYNSIYCSFNYKYKGRKYKRYQYVVDKEFLEIGDKVQVLINKNNPKIAYVKGSSGIKNWWINSCQQRV